MMTCVFILLGIVMYGIVIKVMPNNYRSVTLSNYTEEIKNLVSELERESLEEGINEIYNFCIDYSANAELNGNDTVYRFGETADEDTTTQTISSGVTFIDSNTSYIISLSVSEGTVNQIMVTFLNITPIILLLIFVISTLSPSTITKLPIPERTNPSTTYEPTPPSPNTATVFWCKFCNFSSPISSFCLSNISSIFSSPFQCKKEFLVIVSYFYYIKRIYMIQCFHYFFNILTFSSSHNICIKTG